ncbi:hypothetical protein E8E12_009373 [Didymella heteroderae]|uniref:Uncharacterized protein n=1 Tax=Didymella heteroderae TaxID=1769908 RepID=A0A9P4WSQ2_9PLEO|nr:hypothetical protein E8E12_009373 [Didymella heteroderae]
MLIHHEHRQHSSITFTNLHCSMEAFTTVPPAPIVTLPIKGTVGASPRRLPTPLLELPAERARRKAQRAVDIGESRAATAEHKAKVNQETTDWETAKKAMNGGGGVKIVTAEQAAFFIRH